MTYYLAAAILKMLSSYLTMTLIARAHSSKTFADFLWWLSMLPYFSLLDLGYFAVLKGRLARCNVRQLPINLLVALLAGIVAGVIGITLLYFHNSSLNNIIDPHLHWGIVFIICMFIPLGLIADSILQGKSLHNYSRGLDVVGSVMSIVLTFTGVRLNVPVIYLLFFTISPSAILKFLVCLRYVEIKIPTSGEFTWHRMLIISGLNYLIMQLAAAALSSAPVLLCTLIKNETVRADSLLLNKVITSIVAMLSSVMPYIWVRVSQQRDKLQRNLYLSQLRDIMFLSSLAASILFIGISFTLLPTFFTHGRPLNVYSVVMFAVYLFCTANINLASTEMNAQSKFGQQILAFSGAALLAYLVFFAARSVGIEQFAPSLSVAASGIFGLYYFRRIGALKSSVEL